MRGELGDTAQSPHCSNTLQTAVDRCFIREVKNKNRNMGGGGGAARSLLNNLHPVLCFLVHSFCFCLSLSSNPIPILKKRMKNASFSLALNVVDQSVPSYQMSTTPRPTACLQLINTGQDTVPQPDHVNGWPPVLDGAPFPHHPMLPSSQESSCISPHRLQRGTFIVSPSQQLPGPPYLPPSSARAGNSHNVPVDLLKDGKATPKSLIYDVT